MKQSLISILGCIVLALICVSCQPVEDDYGQRVSRSHGTSRKEAKIEKERKRELARLREERADLDKQIAKLDEEARRAERNASIAAEQQRQATSPPVTDAGVTAQGGAPVGDAGHEVTQAGTGGTMPPANPPASGHESTVVNPLPDNAAGAGTAPDTAKASKKNYPTATAVPGKPGLVYSPFNNKPVDVKGIPSGTIVADPQYPPADKKHFRVP